MSDHISGTRIRLTMDTCRQRFGEKKSCRSDQHLHVSSVSRFSRVILSLPSDDVDTMTRQERGVAPKPLRDIIDHSPVKLIPVPAPEKNRDVQREESLGKRTRSMATYEI